MKEIMIDLFRICELESEVVFVLFGCQNIGDHIDYAAKKSHETTGFWFVYPICSSVLLDTMILCFFCVDKIVAGQACSIVARVSWCLN